MRVSELARRAGIAPSAVRFYEAAGVLPRATRSANGYRDYGEADLSRLRLIVVLRRAGLEPARAGVTAQIILERSSALADVPGLVAGQRELLAMRRAALDQLEAELLDLESTAEAAALRSHQAEGALRQRDPIRVLFVCTGNSARSQIAEALLRVEGGAGFEAVSAGTHPRALHPSAVAVLAEVGIDWRWARSKLVTEFVDQSFDYVITVCDRARRECATFPGSDNSLHWGLDDPAGAEGGEGLAPFRRTRSELTTRLRPFIELARRARGDQMSSTLADRATDGEPTSPTAGRRAGARPPRQLTGRT